MESRGLNVKVKTLVCNCKGLESFRYADMNTLPFDIESDLEVQYAAVLPQLCAQSGLIALADVLHSAEDDPDTYVLTCACAEETQKKLFKKTLRDAQFDEKRFVPVDARNTTNDGILERIRERLAELADPDKRRH
jgi:heterodisulfide reductase subunit A-like polyferredoxin